MGTLRNNFQISHFSSLHFSFDFCRQYLLAAADNKCPKTCRKKRKKRETGKDQQPFLFIFLFNFFFSLNIFQPSDKEKKKRKTFNKYQAVLQWLLWNIEYGREIIFTIESHSKANMCWRWAPKGSPVSIWNMTCLVVIKRIIMFEKEKRWTDWMRCFVLCATITQHGRWLSIDRATCIL